MRISKKERKQKTQNICIYQKKKTMPNKSNVMIEAGYEVALTRAKPPKKKKRIFPKKKKRLMQEDRNNTQKPKSDGWYQ